MGEDDNDEKPDFSHLRDLPDPDPARTAITRELVNLRFAHLLRSSYPGYARWADKRTAVREHARQLWAADENRELQKRDMLRLLREELGDDAPSEKTLWTWLTGDPSRDEPDLRPSYAKRAGRPTKHPGRK